MTHSDLAQREHGARARTVSRTAVVIALGIALLFSGRSVRAESHPVHMRRLAVARPMDTTQSNHAKPHSAASRSRASKGASARKSGAHAKSRRHKQPTQVGDHDPPVLHRASTRRRSRGARGVRIAMARPSKNVRETGPSIVNSAAAMNSSTAMNEPAVVAPAAAEAEPLTVNDFLRAASAPEPASVGMYASGESHPDEDVSSSLERAATLNSNPATAKHPIVLARVEAASKVSKSAPTAHTAPSDIVGAHVVAPEKVTRTISAEDDVPAPELRAPSHEELSEELERPVVLPGLYRNGRLIVPPPLRGTREILVHQNTMADDEGLKRVQDNDDLRHLRSTRQLIDFPESASLHINPELAGDRRCARPWTVHFATDVARAYYARFHTPLQVNSAVRTVAYQVRLRRVNGNAAGIAGDAASPHLTGEALDFGKHGMSVAEIAWMRSYLLPLMQSGKLDVEEEFQQACFHISVYRTYAPVTKRHTAARSEVAQLREPRVPRITSRAYQVQ